MRLFKNASTYMFLAAALVFSACSKNVIEPVPTIQPPSSNTNVKIVYASAYTINYKVHLRTNDAIVSNVITYSTPFPGGGLNTGGGNYPDYLSLAPGPLKISVAVPNNNAGTDSIVLSNNTVTLEASKFYSVYLADTSVSTQAFVITENKAVVEGDFTRYKFVNAIPNSTGVDVYFAGNKVASNVAYKSASAEFTLARGATGQFSIRNAGDDPATPAILQYPAASTLLTVPYGRIMTVYGRGYIGSTGNLAPAISLLYN